MPGLADLCDSSQGRLTPNAMQQSTEQSHNTYCIAACYNLKTNQTSILKLLKFQNEVGADKKY